MAVNAANVLIGSPDQATTGAILSAPLGTSLPTSAVDTLDGAFKDSGYVSADGLQLTPDISTADINEWGGALVRRVLENFNGTLSWTMIETNEESMSVAFGDSYVTATAANASHGNQLAVALGAHLPEAKSFVFKMKDGDNRILIVAPNAQITEVGEVSFVNNDAIGWQVTLSCYPDSTGESIYIYTDDGQTV